jgi:hypothetical protein
LGSGSAEEMKITCARSPCAHNAPKAKETIMFHTAVIIFSTIDNQESFTETLPHRVLAVLWWFDAFRVAE